MIKRDSRIPPAKGKLGVLLPGMGAVTSTFIAGVELAKKGLGKPVGSLTQLQTIRLGKRYENRAPLIKDFVPLASLEQLVFGGWDLFPDDVWTAALKAGAEWLVVEEDDVGDDPFTAVERSLQAVRRLAPA